MSNTLFAAISLFTPVHALVRRVWNKRRSRNAGTPVTRDIRDLSEASQLARTAGNGRPACDVRHQHPRRIVPTLRVLRVAEAGQSSFHGGRMVISGRMADVCAELDRLAAQEAALQAGT